MRPLRWFTRLVALTLLSSCLLMAATAVGNRGSPALAVARAASDRQGELRVMVIDVERELAVLRRFYFPYLTRVDWSVWPPEVEQREPVLDFSRHTLYSLDLGRVQFTPLFDYQLHSQSRGLEFVRSGSNAAVYVKLTGEITMLGHDLSNSPRVNVDEHETQSLVWSPDGRRLAIKAFRAAPLILLDESGSRTYDVFRDSAPLWSPDSRRILFTQDSFIERNGRLRVYDAESGEILPAVNDIPGRSGVWCDSDRIAFVQVTPDGLHTVQVLDIGTAQITQALDTQTAGGQEILSLSFAPRPECDWLILTMRRPQELVARLYRLHVPTGELTRLGENTRIIALSPEALVYDSNTARVALSVEYATFEQGSMPEVYGRVPSQIEAVVWYGDFRQGLFLRSGELWRIDVRTARSRPLAISTPIESFLIVPTGQ